MGKRTTGHERRLRRGLFAFLDRATDVVSVVDNYRDGSVTIAVLDGRGRMREFAPTALVATDRHRVWLVQIHGADTSDLPRIRESIRLWCQSRTLGDTLGRTFRPLLLDGGHLPVRDSLASFEEFAAETAGHYQR